MTTNSPFREALIAAIRKEITHLKRQRITGMGVANLLQVVKPPSVNLDGAPRGTNAQFFYKELFYEVAADLDVRGFEIYTADFLLHHRTHRAYGHKAYEYRLEAVTPAAKAWAAKALSAVTTVNGMYMLEIFGHADVVSMLVAHRNLTGEDLCIHLGKPYKANPVVKFLAGQGCTDLHSDGTTTTYTTPNALRGAVVKHDAGYSEHIDGQHIDHPTLAALKAAWKEGALA